MDCSVEQSNKQLNFQHINSQLRSTGGPVLKNLKIETFKVQRLATNKQESLVLPNLEV